MGEGDGEFLADTEKDPAEPWTDPLTGEVDWEGMKEDLGIVDGSEEDPDGEDW